LVGGSDVVLEVELLAFFVGLFDKLQNLLAETYKRVLSLAVQVLDIVFASALWEHLLISKLGVEE
jgi:hypothetical protein